MLNEEWKEIIYTKLGAQGNKSMLNEERKGILYPK
jgi:hypothetical protein